MDGARGPDRSGRLRLALLPAHRPLADAPCRAAPVRARLRRTGRGGSAALPRAAVLQPPLPQASEDAGRVSAAVVSVLMSVRNGAPWVRAAVESLLAQTLADLEVIVIDDGSTDTTPDVLASLRDPRLVVERLEHAGLTRSLNRALARASAPLVARLDADDVALPERFALQR